MQIILRGLPPLDSSFLFAKEQLRQAISRHRSQPTEANLIRVADVCREAVNIGGLIAREAGFESREFHTLYDIGTDYTRSRWHSKQPQERPKMAENQIAVLVDVIYELQRDVRELKSAQLRKPKVAKVARKEAA